ncbi:MAG: sigma-70 family RNA polymerase sigma factor [Lachnospiraceae bacterium]|nr:sigma-70 family RNA polymerase sigma factor [Lachnospiraceae bacterium]
MFYEKNYWKVYKYVFSKLNQREAAEDLLQEAFLACYEALERYDSSKCALSTWFYVILNN